MVDGDKQPSDEQHQVDGRLPRTPHETTMMHSTPIVDTTGHVLGESDSQGNQEAAPRAAHIRERA